MMGLRSSTFSPAGVNEAEEGVCRQGSKGAVAVACLDGQVEAERR